MIWNIWGKYPSDGPPGVRGIIIFHTAVCLTLLLQMYKTESSKHRIRRCPLLALQPWAGCCFWKHLKSITILRRENAKWSSQCPIHNQHSFFFLSISFLFIFYNLCMFGQGLRMRSKASYTLLKVMIF